MARFSAKHKSRFYSNLEKYARSGMGMERACESLLAQPGLRSAEKSVLKSLLDGIRSGNTIAGALAKSRVKLTAVETEIVHAAEKGGLLEKGFGHLAGYFQRVHRTRNRILKGLAYPFVIVHLAIPISIFAISMLSNALNGMTGEGGTPWETAMSIAVWIAWGYLALIGLVILAVWFHKAAKNSPSMDAFLNRIPLLGRARKSLALARFCEVFQINLLAGMRMSESLEGAGSASQSGVIRKASRKGIGVVKEGRPLSDAIFGFPGAYPNDFARGIAAAEQSGELDKEITHWAMLYNEDAGDAMDRLAVWTPKIFYFLVVFLVAGLFIRVAIAYRDLLQGLLDFDF